MRPQSTTGPHDRADLRSFPLQGGASASTALGLGAVLAIEAVAFHLFFATRSQLLAWSFTAVNVAALVGLWRGYLASAHRSLTVDASGIHVVAGRISCRAPWGNVASVEPATWRSAQDGGPGYVNAASPMAPNILVTLRTPTEVRFAFGIRKRVSRIGLRVEPVDVALEALSIQ